MPYAYAYVEYEHANCSPDNISEGIAPGKTWTATSRGLCMVETIYADLTLPDGRELTCPHNWSQQDITDSLFSMHYYEG
jgi:hypothetical protein